MAKNDGWKRHKEPFWMHADAQKAGFELQARRGFITQFRVVMEETRWILLYKELSYDREKSKKS